MNLLQHLSLPAPSIGISQGTSAVLRCFFVFLSVHGLVSAQDYGPSYRQTFRLCTAHDECRQDVGEVCWYNFKGCSKGECKCDPRFNFKDSDGHCRPARLGDEECKDKDQCPDGMECLGEVCACQRGEMTSDKTFCREPHQQLLGEECIAGRDNCYQKAANGYTTDKTECGRENICKCVDGFKEERGGCTQWNVAEYGCVKDHQCYGGALCLDRRCTCPSDYVVAADNTKCVKVTAKFDLKLEDSCDERHERRYCASGLICHQCAGADSRTCVQFVEAQARRHTGSDATFIMPLSSFCVIIAISLSLFLIILR